MQTSSCDDIFDNVDLVTEILLRLPVKHLIRCKCVCKKWFSLISDPKFSYSHTLRLCQNPYPNSLLLPKNKHRDEAKFKIVPFTVADDGEQSRVRIFSLHALQVKIRPVINYFFSIIQSCNGLLLYYCSYSISRRLRRRYEYRVCNLATGHYVSIGYPKGKYYEYSSMPNIAFEPLRSPHYKVIVFSSGNETNDANEIRVGVHSSETRSWSEVRVCCSVAPGVFRESGVYCNGAIHWYTLGKGLVYFDVDSLCFNELSGPEFVESNGSCVKYFGESGGRLHLILDDGNRSMDFDIWELKEDYSGWNVRYHVDFNLMIGDEDAILWRSHPSFSVVEGDAIVWRANPSFSVLCVVRQANEEHSMLVLFVDSKIVSYNLKDHASRVIPDEVDKVFGAFQYFHTLACVGLNHKRLGDYLSRKE